jgi:hypothetical protein
MTRRIHRLTVATVIGLTVAGTALAQDRPAPAPKLSNPSLRAALHELREARKSILDAKNGWPESYRERALASTQEAIDSVRIILAVKDIDSFVGVERKPDYYKKYKDHPRLRAALDDLRAARDELKGDKEKVGELREKVLDDIDVAVGDILTLLRYKPKK